MWKGHNETCPKATPSDLCSDETRAERPNRQGCVFIALPICLLTLLLWNRGRRGIERTAPSSAQRAVSQCQTAQDGTGVLSKVVSSLSLGVCKPLAGPYSEGWCGSQAATSNGVYSVLLPLGVPGGVLGARSGPPSRQRSPG